MPPFKDDQILIIVPGSQTTLAQLGLPESFTPATHRFPTRMFPAPDGKTFEPFKIRSKKKEATNGADVDMGGTEVPDEEEELIEDPDDDEGAIYPIQAGKIVHKEALFAFMQHIYNTLVTSRYPPPCPIMLISQPQWTPKVIEDVGAFIFDTFQVPALCIMDSALATSYAFGAANTTVVDVGFEKVDITAITDFQVSAKSSCLGSGGEAMTRNLMGLLKAKDFTRDMAEQLKRSPICEILPIGTPFPGTGEIEEPVSNPAAAASTGATSSGPDVKITEPPRAPDNDDNEDYVNGDDELIDDEGVLDVASIVTSGKTQEYLAKIQKDKEKAERAAIRKANREQEKADAAAAAAAARAVRLPNSKRPRAIFHYEEIVKDAPESKRQKTPEPANIPEPAHVTEPAHTTEPADPAVPAVPVVAEDEVNPLEDGAAVPVDATGPPEVDEAQGEQQKTSNKEEKRKGRDEEASDRVRKDIEIGIERFQAASDGYIEELADAIYRTVLSVDDVSKRQDAWDSLVICGGGSKLKGFKDALITTLTNRYLVSPSSATMFMSELPSNLATPSGTGSMTPNASFSSTPHPVPSASAVNPLLLAATTASNPALNHHISTASFHTGPTHSSHSQSPTSIKAAIPPSYFPEWKTFDEAVFLGSQVAAKVIFVVDQGLSKGFLSRMEFNEDGPNALHQIGLF